jgi:hypothetical protein
MSYADRLNDIKKKAQMKAERFKNTPRKPVDIADQDRPWFASDIIQIQSTSPFPDKNEDNLKPDPQNFLESALANQTIVSPVLERNLEIVSHSPAVSEVTNEVGQHQPFSKEDTKGIQRGHSEGDTKETQREHNKNKGDTKGTIKGTHKGLQRGHKNTTPNVSIKGLQRGHKYSHLRGWNKKIVDLIHDICRETVSKVTYSLTNNTISEMLDMPRHSVKTTMQRLKSKGHVIVTEFNDGRGGWSRYTLPEEFFNDIPQSERVLKGAVKGTQRDYKGNNKGNTQGDTNRFSSSSILNIKETTTRLGDEWNFEITPYARFGFTTSQIKQLASLSVISAVDVEQSLIEFNYDLENNALPPIKTTKINFLMGLLRAGHAYVSEGFKNEQDAMITEMAKRAEAKRKNRIEEKFGAWEAGLSDEERKEIENKLPTHLMVLHRAHGVSNAEVRNWLFNYYLQVKPQ